MKFNKTITHTHMQLQSILITMPPALIEVKWHSGKSGNVSNGNVAPLVGSRTTFQF